MFLFLSKEKPHLDLGREDWRIVCVQGLQTVLIGNTILIGQLCQGPSKDESGKGGRRKRETRLGLLFW